MQLSELQDQMGLWLEVDTTRLPTLQRTLLLNLAQKELCDLYSLWFFEQSDTLTTVAGTQAYDLPAGFARPGSFFYLTSASTKPNTVVYRSREEFLKLYPDPTVQGSPKHYTLWGNSVVLGPTPDAVYSISRDFYGYLDDLADPTDENELTRKAWDLVLWRANSLCSTYVFEDGREGEWDGKFETAKTRVLITNAKRRSNARRPVSQEPG